MGREGRTLRPLRHLPDLPLVGAARAEAERGRPAGARGLLYDRLRAAQSEQPVAPRVQSRLPQRVRQVEGALRLIHHGAWRLLVDRLLRDDRFCGGRALALRHGGARCGRGQGAGACVSVPPDRRQSQVAQVEPMGRLLGRSEEGLRSVRAHPPAAGGEPVQWPLRVCGGQQSDCRQRRRGALPAHQSPPIPSSLSS